MKALWMAVRFIFLVLFLTACTPSPPKYPDSVEQSVCSLRQAYCSNKRLYCRNVPHPVENALLPRLSFNTEGGTPENNRFDVNASEVPAKAFFLSLFKGTGTNIIIDPKVTGVISMNLHQVTVDETLDAVRDIYGYDYKATSYGYEIFPATLQTRVFTVNYLNVKRTGDSQTLLASSEITNNTINGGTGGTPTVPGTTSPTYPSGTSPTSSPYGANQSNSSVSSTVLTHSETDYWKNLEKGIKAIVGTEGGRSVVIDPHANVVMVKAYPKELREVAQFLDSSERNLNRQVIIEAKVLQVTLDDASQSGIDWTAFGSALKQQGTKVEPETFTPMIKMSLSGFHGSFTQIIHLLENQGNVQILSSPRISTLNNQNAMIKVGNDQFFVTNVTTNLTPTGTTSTTSQSVGLTPFFSGITLDVTPQISSNGNIILFIHPSVSEVKNQTTTIDLGTSGTLILPLAKSTLRESDTIVRAKSGEFIVIGGLMTNLTAEEMAETPLLSRIPFLGSFFRDTQQTSTKSELVILLRPQISNYKSQQCAISGSECRMRGLDRGMHLGAIPEVFGTEGERFED